MNKYAFGFIFYAILIFIAEFSFSQTKVRGTVINSSTKEGIPFVNVSVPSSSIGVLSDEDGVYFLESQHEISRIIASCVGFYPDTADINPNSYNEISFELKPKEYMIEEIIVLPGENPAHKIIRKARQRRKFNNPERFDSYSYEQYSKIELDLNNFSADLSSLKSMKKMKILFEGVDTSAVNGKIYMPVLLSESLSDFYSRKKPKPQRKKEIIKAVQISGVENESVTQYTGQMYTDVNFYENYLGIFEKQFLSPIGKSSILFYKFYLIDSIFVDNKKQYKISFVPKIEQDYAFKGDMLITDSTFALKKIKAQITTKTNIDFVQDMVIEQEFSNISDTVSFITQEYVFIDFNVSKFTAGFFGKKQSFRKNIKINPTFEDNFFSGETPWEIKTLENSQIKDTVFWNENRFQKLSKSEEKIYTMVDSIQKISTFKNMKNLFMTLSFGYLPMGYFEWGPYYDLYSKNTFEGHRFKVGARSTYKLSRFFEPSAYIAYGTKDKEFKYEVKGKFKLMKKPWALLTAFYQDDYTTLGESNSNYVDANVFTTVASRAPNDNLLPAKRIYLDVEKDWTKGLSNTLRFSTQRISPTDSIQFIDKNNNILNRFEKFEVGLNTHLGFNEEYVEAVFSRAVMGSLFPVIEFDAAYGVPFSENSYEYLRLKLSLKYGLYLGFLGKMKFYVESSKIYGTVPFPLLEMHRGNETYLYEAYAFNLMNMYEFASDEYVSIFAEHHLDGLILNKIPLIKYLKFREVIYLNAVWGSLSDKNRNEFQLPYLTDSLPYPYMEFGAGIENILNFFKVDAFWRLTYKDKPNVSKFGFRFGMYVSF